MSEQIRISLGDIARVKKELAPRNAYTWNRILELLGLPLEMASAAGPVEPALPAPADVAEVTSRIGDVDRDDVGKPEIPNTEIAPVFAPGDEVTVEKIGTSVTSPAWSNPANVLADATKQPAVILDPPPALFVPGQERPLITAIAIALAETGDLDEDRVVEQIARGEPLQNIPRRMRPTSRFGVQLLVDWGARLEPLRQDQQNLTTALLRTVGAHRIEVLRFRDFPDLAGPGTRRTWRPYEPPASGTVVLIVSDLSLGWLGAFERTHSFEKWAEWARKVGSAGARPIALVPHGPEHWPDELRHYLPLIHWDRTTTVSTVRGMSGFSVSRQT